MNPSEFQNWCQKLQLNAATHEIIATIRSAPPARRVQGRALNVSGAYPSRKMGLTISFESHTVELWAIYQMEHDPQVLEFYDQPPSFKIQYQAKTGRKIGHYHTPDFFVLRTDSAGWEEWKPEEKLQQLAQKYPSRYQKTEDGLWRCPPGEAHAEPLGLFYHVRSSSELHPIKIQNLMFLSDYIRFTAAIPAQIQARILNRVRTEPGITIAAILAEEPGIRANDVYAMIAQEQLHLDLAVVPLAENWRVQLYIDQATHDAHTHLATGATGQGSMTLMPNPRLLPNTKVIWDSRLWTLVNLGETTTTLLPEEGLPIQLPSGFFLQLLEKGTISIPALNDSIATTEFVRAKMNAASPGDLKEANRRFHLVQAYLERRVELYQDIAPRTLRRWVKQFHEAQASYGCGYIGLLPCTAQRGNRTPRAPSASRDLLDHFIAEYFETPRQAPAASVYRAYQRACEQSHLQALSTYTFYQRLHSRRSPEQTEKRQGAKAAYAEQPWLNTLAVGTPRHGDRPLSIVHIDHTQLDIELRCSTTLRNLGRPWLTMLIDAYSRRILAVYLTFDAPSYRSCMMGLRLIVQRCGRFPQAVVVDGGKEFHSVYFDTLLARYHCIKKTRPAAKPRFGSVIERLFGVTNTEFVYNLLGNTQASKQPRQLTKAIDPKRQAVWTLGELYTYLMEWAYQVYDQNEHPALGMTPREAYLSGLTRAGEREHLYIPYSEAFLMATLPSTKKGLALIQPGKGIKINYLYYWSDAFRNPEVERTQVPVRYDPFDIGVAYAYLQGRWVKCISQYYNIFQGRSEKELSLASDEIRQQSKLTSSSTSVGAKRLADFLSNVQDHEALLLQRLRDLEGLQVLETVAVKSEQVPVAQPITPQAQTPGSNEQMAQLSKGVAPIDLALLPIFEEYK